MDYPFLWGLLAVICGGFMLVYGAQLFKFVLAFAGFYIGFVVIMRLPIPNEMLQFVAALIVGGIIAFLLFRTGSILLYAAGALLGLVAGLVLASLIGQSGTTVGYIIGLAGAVGGGFIGRRLGTWGTILASAFAGAYILVSGLTIILGGSQDVTETGMLSVSTGAILVFFILAGISILAQLQIRDLRDRLLRR